MVPMRGWTPWDPEGGLRGDPEGGGRGVQGGPRGRVKGGLRDWKARAVPQMGKGGPREGEV